MKDHVAFRVGGPNIFTFLIPNKTSRALANFLDGVIITFLSSKFILA